MRLIMSSSRYMYLFRILCYSVLCLVIVIELLLCFCCVLYNLNWRVLLCDIEFLSQRLKVNAGTLPFIAPPIPRTPEVYAIERSSATRRTKVTCLYYGQYFASNFLIEELVVKLINVKVLSCQFLPRFPRFEI